MKDAMVRGRVGGRDNLIVIYSLSLASALVMVTPCCTGESKNSSDSTTPIASEVSDVGSEMDDSLAIEVLQNQKAVAKDQIVTIDSVGILYGISLVAAGPSGTAPERFRGKSWPVHTKVRMIGYPQGGNKKTPDQFVTPFAQFRVRKAWADTYFSGRDYQGKLIQVITKLYWRDPYFAKEPQKRDEVGSIQVPTGALVPGGFELEVLSTTVLDVSPVPPENSIR